MPPLPLLLRAATAGALEEAALSCSHFIEAMGSTRTFQSGLDQAGPEGSRIRSSQCL